MTTYTQHPLVTRYLKDLDRALRDFPADRRREIVEEIHEHIAETAAERGEQMTEAELRTLLDQVGHPETIAEDARDRFGIKRRRAGAMEAIAVVSLLFGGLLVPVIGWVFGVALLWASKVWSTRDKLLGTFVVPGGLAAPLFLGALVMTSQTCIAPGGGQCADGTGIGMGEVILITLGVAPIATAVYLARKAFRS